MKAVLAEKPSVAREIAKLLGADQKNDGYMEGNGFCVTWAIGHLVALGLPQDYGFSGFQQEKLPMMPDPFILTVRKIRRDKSYIPDPGALKQLKVINTIFNRCDSIIVATDAGREGELIFRYIYEYLNCRKPFERLWISSLTERAIRTGFENLTAGADFDGLFHAARCRSQADWLVGINASQALSIVAGNEVYSLGRVQTPTLAIISERYLANINFEAKKYWQVDLEHLKNSISFVSKCNLKFDNRQDAKDMQVSVLRKGVAMVDSVDAKTVNEHPPLLFDLTGLQKEANKRWRFTAEQTLRIAQSLYEQKFITYPRTGSKYIPEDLWAEIPILIRELGKRASCTEGVEKLKFARYNKHIVNDVKVTDHHGILITDKIPFSLDAEEDKIYEMVASRLLESLSQDCVKELTSVQLSVLHYQFEIKGSKILEEGWRSIRKLACEENTDEIQEIPLLNKGDVLKIERATVQEKHTKAPPLLTEASLLNAMEQAGKKIENKEQQRALRDIGIGTPATRAAIIETLFQRNYIIRDKNYIKPTEKGLKVYEWTISKYIADVSMTANWELALTEIENNQREAKLFEKEIIEYAHIITAELLSLTVVKEPQSKLNCPKCKVNYIVIKDKLVECGDQDCDWKQWRNICGVNLSIKEVEQLITKGKTTLLKGLKSKSAKLFDAYLILNKDLGTSFEFEKKANARRK